MQSAALLSSERNCARFTHSPRVSYRQKKRFTCISRAKADKDLLNNIADELKEDEAKADAPARKGFGTQQPESKKKQKAKQKEQSQPYKLAAPPPQTPAQDLEANVVRLLALLFVVFFCEGIFLAISGFLPEAADNFATNVVYPAFSPTLGVFLVISVIYGLAKTRQGDS